jgi:hypothetical protein
MRPERAPWWRRRLGRWGVVCGVLVAVSVTLGVALDRDERVVAAQLSLLGAAAIAYVVGLLRSPD